MPLSSARAITGKNSTRVKTAPKTVALFEIPRPRTILRQWRILLFRRVNTVPSLLIRW